MRKVFADTLYWIATVRPNDPYSLAAMQARQAIGTCLLVTTDEVLGEFVTAFSKGGSDMRARAVQTVRDILASTEVEVVAQSHASFVRALSRFSARPDKEYSLTDCSSMNVMDANGIKDVFTHDHHFAQEGYNVLIGASLMEKRR
jgi:uncharacterized protein